MRNKPTSIPRTQDYQTWEYSISDQTQFETVVLLIQGAYLRDVQPAESVSSRLQNCTQSIMNYDKMSFRYDTVEQYTVRFRTIMADAPSDQAQAQNELPELYTTFANNLAQEIKNDNKIIAELGKYQAGSTTYEDNSQRFEEIIKVAREL